MNEEKRKQYCDELIFYLKDIRDKIINYRQTGNEYDLAILTKHIGLLWGMFEIVLKEVKNENSDS